LREDTWHSWVVVERIAWSLVRSRLKSELATELRICIEVLWALPGPETPFDVVLLPSNVFVGGDGSVELRLPHPGDQRYFRRYLAPELGAGKPATLVSAIYSLGALLFEAVSGSRFESCESVERELGYLAARAQATGLSRDVTDSQLLGVVLKATRVRPEQRWATAESFSRELDRVARHRTATREELAWLVKRWVRRSSRAGVRPGLDPTAWDRADVLPLPFVPFLGEAKASPGGALGPLRSTTLRGFSLDLTSYPPPRPAVNAVADAPTAGSQALSASKFLDRDLDPCQSPTPRARPAEFNREPLPVPAAPPRQFVPASLHEVTSLDVESAFAGTDAPHTACPRSGVRLTRAATGIPTERRSAALITALAVAIPLLGMTLWNWRASAQAANRSPAPWAQQTPATAASSPERAAGPRNYERDPLPEPRASATASVPVPVIDMTNDAPRIEPKRANRQPRAKPRGPDDYGI